MTALMTRPPATRIPAVALRRTTDSSATPRSAGGCLVCGCTPAACSAGCGCTCCCSYLPAVTGGER